MAKAKNDNKAPEAAAAVSTTNTAALEKAKAIQPIAQRRVALLKTMTPALQAVVTACAERIIKESKGVLLTKYAIGEHVAAVLEEEAKYGDKAIDQMASYLNWNNNALYDTRNMVKMFTKAEIEELASRQTVDGRFINFEHIRCLVRLQSSKERNTLLKRTFTEGLTAQQLATEIDAGGAKKTHTRSGGRKPALPTSALAAAQQIASTCQTGHNRGDAWQQTLFDEVDTMTVDRMDGILLEKLKVAKEQVDTFTADLSNHSVRLEKNIKRVEKVVKAQAKATSAAVAQNKKEAAALDTVKQPPVAARRKSA